MKMTLQNTKQLVSPEPPADFVEKTCALLVLATCACMSRKQAFIRTEERLRTRVESLMRDYSVNTRVCMYIVC